jgi:hypothetical protein
MTWAYPDGTAGHSAYDLGALQAVVVDGRVLLAGMFCDVEGWNRVDLRDAATGQVIDAYFPDKLWWHEVAEHFTAFDRHGGTYILYLRPRWRYHVQRVTPRGFAPAEHEFRGDGDHDDFCAAPAPAVLDGRPAILTGDGGGAVFRDWRAPGRVLASWAVPEGWTCAGLVSIGGRPYAWLGYDVPEETPSEDRWRVAAEHGHRLWDVIADAPVGPPLLVRGFRWGPWALDGRPVVLFKVDWHHFQVWDVARRQPIGPSLSERDLGDQELRNPSVGLLHGRRALAGTVGESLRVWDIGTGLPLDAVDLPDKPIATAIGADDTAWAITRTGYVGSITVTAAQIHPVAARHLR